METVSSLVGYFLAYLVGLTETQQQAVMTLTAFGTLGFLLAIAMWNKRRSKRAYRKWRGAKMTRKERLFYRKLVIAKRLTDALEEAVFEGELTRQEVQREYKKLGWYLKNGEIVPAKTKPTTVQERILEAQRAIRESKPVSIPGPKPGEGVPTAEIIPIRRKFGERALRRKLAS